MLSPRILGSRFSIRRRLAPLGKVVSGGPESRRPGRRARARRRGLRARFVRDFDAEPGSARELGRCREDGRIVRIWRRLVRQHVTVLRLRRGSLQPGLRFGPRSVAARVLCDGALQLLLRRHLFRLAGREWRRSICAGPADGLFLLVEHFCLCGRISRPPSDGQELFERRTIRAGPLEVLLCLFCLLSARGTGWSRGDGTASGRGDVRRHLRQCCERFREGIKDALGARRLRDGALSVRIAVRMHGKDERGFVRVVVRRRLQGGPLREGSAVSSDRTSSRLPTDVRQGSRGSGPRPSRRRCPFLCPSHRVRPNWWLRRTLRSNSRGPRPRCSRCH